MATAHRTWRLNHDPLDLVERDRVPGAVVELGGLRAFVRRHRLRVLQRAARVQVDGDPGGPKRMAIDPALQAHRGGAALDHAVGVDPVHGVLGQRAAVPHGRAEEGGLAAVPQCGGVEIGVQVRFEGVMRRHLVALAAFFVEPHPPALALGVVVLDAHGHHGANAGEGEHHQADERPVPQPDHGRGVDAVQEGARLVTGEHGGLAALHHVLRPAYRVGGVGRENATGHEPIEQHPERSQVLLHGRLLIGALQSLDIGRHMQRLDGDQFAELMLVAPGEEPAHGPIIGHAGVRVADGGGEEFEEASDGLVTGVGDERRDTEARGSHTGTAWPVDDGEFVHGWQCNITPFMLQ